MCLFMEVLHEIGSMAVVLESSCVFVVMYGGASSGLSHVGFVAVWTGLFVNSR
jgi:hypothetical protein